ncbi:alpha/beta fold hydrolase [Fluviispira multicolorata]|uniref:Alpha/beta fold hydrolase n=1 Tax=Fluviispira multicolorata TaxID=2654512 RepID=A0A833JEQ2_9BACT|nr:alpha/beta hydrolase [Fluviispira multicolorata]KAB8029959.1 alpha/beta fold hydrolase [Fluviispira multicolorata]
MHLFENYFIDVNGYNTRYWSVGSSPSIILLLHGFALSVEFWSENILELSKDHKVIAVDLLGFGQTDKPKSKPKLENHPLFIHEFLKKLNIKKVKIIGHSMGGLISLKFSQMFPEMVEHLVLIGSPGFRTDIPIHLSIFSLPFLGEIMVKPNKKGLENALNRNTFNKNVIKKEQIELLYNYSLNPQMNKVLLWVNRSAVNIFGIKKHIVKTIKKEIHKLKMPVMIIWGKEDSIIYVSHAHAGKELIQHSRLVIFENCGHMPQIEYPEKFNEIVLDFFSQ